MIVEPGTTAGYRRVLAARDAVIAAGGSTLAPCPHDASCPLPDGDWCHFSTRLPRSRTHRLAKGAERGFEDEKFAYVVLCRAPHPRADGPRDPPPRPAARSRRARPLHACGARAANGVAEERGRVPARAEARWGDPLPGRLIAGSTRPSALR